jgi:GNAT superfamily N-acetyltransferase
MFGWLGYWVIIWGWHGNGLSAGLLKDAMLRTIQAANIVGIRTMAVHAKNDSARTFYEHFGFQLSPTDPLNLFLLDKGLNQIVTIQR